MITRSRTGHHLELLPSLGDNGEKKWHHYFVFLCHSLMDREVALLAEMDKVKAEASEYMFLSLLCFSKTEILSKIKVAECF